MLCLLLPLSFGHNFSCSITAATRRVSSSQRLVLALSFQRNKNYALQLLSYAENQNLPILKGRVLNMSENLIKYTAITYYVKAISFI